MSNENYFIWRTNYSQPDRRRLDVEFYTTNKDLEFTYDPMYAKLYFNKDAAFEAFEGISNNSDMKIICCRDMFLRELDMQFKYCGIVSFKMFCLLSKHEPSIKIFNPNALITE